MATGRGDGHARRLGRVVGRTLVVILGVSAACAAEPLGPGPDERGVLFVGNSLTYTHDLPGMLDALLERTGQGFFIASESRPNYGLPDHWSGSAARQRISDGRWEVVVLQQGPSATEGRPYLLEYAARFAEEIRAVGGQPALYMVWPSVQRDFDFDGVFDAYRTAAEQIDGLFFPGGEAWRIAWERDPDLELYGPDGFHPSVLGTYLVALVMYEQLSGEDARALSPVVPAPGGPVTLDGGVARTLQEAAHEANVRHARTPGGSGS